MEIKTEAKKKKIDIRKTEKYKTISDYFAIVMIGILICQLNLLMMLFVFKKSIIFLHIVTWVTSALFFLIVKDGATEKQKKTAFKVFKLSLVIFALSIINHFIVTGLNKIASDVLFNKISFLMVFINFGLLIVSIAFFKKEETQNVLDVFYEESFLDKILKLDEEIVPGDAIIGVDMETKKPVRLPLKDRFLHSLILGPTGCGKTAQSIIPMINRDIQFKEIGIIVIEPKGDLAEKVFAMAKYYDRNVLYFNPILPDCPYFNPLCGKESDVVENLATTFRMLNPDSPTFFLDQAENLMRKSIKLLKRLYHEDATLLHLDTLVWNTGGAGRKMVMEFSRISSPNQSIANENKEIAQWFLNDYFTGSTGDRSATKTYEHCSGVRTQISKLVSNEYLRKVLNPPPGVGSDINFDKALADGDVITIATAQGALRELGRYLGYFIILQLQSAVFRRPGREATRRPNMLFIDEFQLYSNPQFGDMLTQGRSYRVASHLATQARDQIGMGGGKDGKAFVQLVSTNARNKIIYPGISFADAKYYSDEFGEELEVSEKKSVSRQRFNPIFGMTLKAPTESVSVSEKNVPRYTPSDIIYRKFGMITYCLIKDNSIQHPGVSQIEFIPKELNDILDKMVDEYNEIQFKKSSGVFEAMAKNVNKEVFDPMDDLFNEHAVVKEIKDPISEGHKNEEAYRQNFDNENDTFMDDDDKVKTENNHVISKDNPIIGGDLNISDEEDDLI